MTQIRVTTPLLPALEKLHPLLEDIWQSGWLTNGGRYHEMLERKLEEHLGVDHLSLFANGTLPLLTALQALDIHEGEVITTPYTFVATAHSILWNGLTPVFADVDPVYGNLDPDAIERCVTDRTVAIMPVHVYGNPCDIKGIGQVAKRHGLKVIYDAAHAFGVKVEGESILKAGDFSTLSFHATKTYNTAEGGALVSPSAGMKERVDFLKNFGFEDETTVVGIGINSKMDEVRAALGLLNLDLVEEATQYRRNVALRYRELLREMPGIRYLEDIPGVVHNYGYFPIFVDEREYGISRDTLYERMKSKGILARRYFYPLVTDFPAYRRYAEGVELPNALRLADSVICLPIHHQLSMGDVDRIVSVVKDRR